MMQTSLRHHYKPVGAALAAFKCKDDEVLLSGPAGTGKSRAALEKLHLMALKNPGMRGLMVRKTLTSLTSTGLVTYREAVALESIEVGHVTWYGGSSQEAACYRYTNGSRIVVGGMDKATRIMSSEYDVVYVQEATELTENDWEAITSRLRNGKISFQQLIADCNPDVPHHWLKVRADRGDTTLLESRHADNPVLYQDGQPTERGAAYLSKLDRLTGPRRARLRDGLWVSAEGLVYEDWDPAVHLVDNKPVPDDWERFWSIDFGFTNPFVCQFWAVDPDGRLWLYREIYMTKRTVDAHAQQIMSIVCPGGRMINGEYTGGVWKEPRPRRIICDHDAEGRATFTKTTSLSTTPANKKVKDGIQAVQERHKLREDGTPGLYIMRDALVEIDQALREANQPTCTADEVVGYIWDAAKDMPVKSGDHGMDAKRYMVADKDMGVKTRLRYL